MSKYYLKQVNASIPKEIVDYIDEYFNTVKYDLTDEVCSDCQSITIRTVIDHNAKELLYDKDINDYLEKSGEIVDEYIVKYRSHDDHTEIVKVYVERKFKPFQ